MSWKEKAIHFNPQFGTSVFIVLEKTKALLQYFSHGTAHPQHCCLAPECESWENPCAHVGFFLPVTSAVFLPRTSHPAIPLVRTFPCRLASESHRLGCVQSSCLSPRSHFVLFHCVSNKKKVGVLWKIFLQWLEKKRQRQKQIMNNHWYIWLSAHPKLQELW